MMKLISLTKVALIALAVGLLTAPAAEAQRERRGARSAQAAEVLFPDTQRPDKPNRTSQRGGRILTALIKERDKENFDRVIALGLELAEDSRANDFERALALQYVGAAYIDKDDYPRAIEYLQRAVDADGLPNNNHFQTMLQVAQLQLSEELYAEALDTIDRFLSESGSRKPEHLALKGNILYRLERYPEAAQLLQQAIEAHEAPPASWSQILMASYFEMDRPQEAARIAERLAQANPDDKTLLLNLSSIYVQADMLDKAAAVLEDMRARGMFTQERDYQQLYRIYANMEGKDMLAVAVIREGLDKGILQPAAEPYTVMAQAYYFADRPQEAIEAYREAAKHATTGDTALNLARVLYEVERYAEAKQAANEALQKGLRRPGDAWIILGNVEFYGLDNRAAGIAAFQEAAKYPETKEQAERWLRQVRQR